MQSSEALFTETRQVTIVQPIAEVDRAIFSLAHVGALSLTSGSQRTSHPASAWEEYMAADWCSVINRSQQILTHSGIMWMLHIEIGQLAT